MLITSKKLSVFPYWFLGLFSIYCSLAYYLAFKTFGSRFGAEEELIYDVMALDFWGLMLAFLVVAVYMLRVPLRTKSVLLTVVVSIYGGVEVLILLSGTDFAFNAYWGDQIFRTAMITHFSEIGWGDFYYKGLPPFYPPLYYGTLGFLAKITNIEAYKWLKYGLFLIQLLSPILLFSLWKGLAGYWRAALIVSLTFLFSPFVYQYQLLSPHTFLGCVFFIPWWLKYVEQVNVKNKDLLFYITGGILGALIFSAYLYPFLIATVLLGVLLFRSKYHGRSLANAFSLKSVTLVMGLTTVFSSPYWAPTLVSVISAGIDRSRGGWFHMGSTGYDFFFLEVTLLSALFFVSILYLSRRKNAPLTAGVGYLLLGSGLFYIIASFMGSQGMSLNLVKARDFITLLSPVGIALSIGAGERLTRNSRFGKPVWSFVVLILFFGFLVNIHNFSKGAFVRKAKATSVPTWNLGDELRTAGRGKVVLSGIAALPSFYPIHAFLPANEHYSHPAGRFVKRFSFLQRLQYINNPGLFHLALRSNIFDTIDYFQPVRDSAGHFLPYSISNYPNRHSYHRLRISPTILQDTSILIKIPGNEMYRVVENREVPANASGDTSTVSSLSLFDTHHVRCLSPFIQGAKREYFSTQVNDVTQEWRTSADIEPLAIFDDAIELLSYSVVRSNDTTIFMFDFRPIKAIPQEFKVMFHVFPADDAAGRLNVDFLPEISTRNWSRYEMYTSIRKIPQLTKEFSFTLGFFRGEEKLGEPISLRVSF